MAVGFLRDALAFGLLVTAAGIVIGLCFVGPLNALPQLASFAQSDDF